MRIETEPLPKITGSQKEGLESTNKGVKTGLLVDDVSQVMEVAQSRIDLPLSTLVPEKAQYIKGEFRHLGR